MAGPLKIGILWLSVHPLWDQGLFHTHRLTQLTFLCTCPRRQLVMVLIKGVLGVCASSLFHQTTDVSRKEKKLVHCPVSQLAQCLSVLLTAAQIIPPKGH